MSARWWTFGIWALAAASAVYWGLKLLSPGLPVPAHTLLAQPGDGLKGDLSRVWGADTPAPVVAESAPQPVNDNRFALLGVLSPRASERSKVGVALIAVDGKPAKAFRVGSVVDGEQVLQTVQPRGATLGPRGGPALVSLNIAPPPEAARGTPGGPGAQNPAANPGFNPNPVTLDGVAPQGQQGPQPMPVPNQAPRLPPGFPAPAAVPSAPPTIAPALPQTLSPARPSALMRAVPSMAQPAAPSGQNQR